MENWNKKKVAPEVIKELHDRFGVDSLTASIFARRNIIDGNDIMYFLENDMRFTHNPFCFNTMEDAVDRILDAKEEGEKVLVFGDRDVDGITSTAIMYGCLKGMGIDCTYKLPSGDDSYGLTTDVIDEFAKNYGSLIITVDCGISNAKEIAYAKENGIDVLVSDHHNPPGALPENTIIVNPKLKELEYPFDGISGCLVAFKIVKALRFSKTELYKTDICLLNVRPGDDEYIIECVKLRNLVEKDSCTLRIKPGEKRISETPLVEFLKGQQIFVWNENVIKKQLEVIFGKGIDFNFYDIQGDVESLIPQVKGMSLLKLKDLSKIAHYSDKPSSELEGFVNIFITYINRKLEKAFPQHAEREEKDIQLVTLAALADIMPLKNENRIFIKNGIALMNKGKTCPGLIELFAHTNQFGKRITATDLSWSIIPILNAAGRLGQPELSLELFLEEDPIKREAITEKLLELNSQRKAFVATAQEYVGLQAKESLQTYDGKLCFVMDERINRGVVGLVASKLMSTYNVPTIALTFIDNDTAVGSMRSTKGFSCTEFLDKFGNLFTNHGGHNAAAGFSFKRINLELFLNKLKEVSKTISITKDVKDSVDVDAEIPSSFMSPELIKIVDKFEPYGEENPQLLFMSKDLRIADVQIVGKTERQHLKLTFDCGQYKIPAMFWGEAERLNRDFRLNDNIDILYNVTRSAFNGNETQQLILLETNKSST